MSKTKEESKIDAIVSPFSAVLDYNALNHELLATDNANIGKISENTLRNVAKWALNGASIDEIAQNLELSTKQFKTLCTLCPVFVSVMQLSKASAEVLLVGTMYERAIGCKIRKQTPVHIKDYENGRVVGEHIEIITVEEELPPEPSLLKYIAEKRLSEKFGEKIVDIDSDTIKFVDNLSPEQMKELEKQLNEK